MGSPHPRVLLASAVDRLGEVAVVEWCCRLMTDTERVDDPDVVLLGGSEEWLPYWRRTWGVRGLLYVFSDGQQVVDALAAALADGHWRVREMACKVVRAHRVGALALDVASLADDPNARVRSAAERALVALGEAAPD
jgi:hypothetical protein